VQIQQKPTFHSYNYLIKFALISIMKNYLHQFVLAHYVCTLLHFQKPIHFQVLLIMKRTCLSRSRFSRKYSYDMCTSLNTRLYFLGFTLFHFIVILFENKTDEDGDGDYYSKFHFNHTFDNHANETIWIQKNIFSNLIE
jgi:hypothetical protein